MIHFCLGLPRGYVILSKRAALPTIMFRYSSHISITGSSENLARVTEFEKRWREFLSADLLATGLMKHINSTSDKDIESRIGCQFHMLHSAGIKSAVPCGNSLNESELHLSQQNGACCSTNQPAVSVVRDSNKNADENICSVSNVKEIKCDEFVNECVNNIIDAHEGIDVGFSLFDEQFNNQISNISDSHCCTVLAMTVALENTYVANIVRRVLKNRGLYIPHNYSSAIGHDSQLHNDESLQLRALVTRWHYLTACILLWPYEKMEVCKKSFSNGHVLKQMMKEELDKLTCSLLKDELLVLKQQLSFVLLYSGYSSFSKDFCMCANNPLKLM